MLKNMNIGIRLALLVAVLLMATLVIGVFGLSAAGKSNTALKASYLDHLEPSGMIGKVMMLMGDNRSQVMLGLQHNPDNPLSKMHEHPLTLHTDAIIKNRDEITAIWQAYSKRELAAEEKTLADKYAVSRAKYVTEGLAPARESLLAGDFQKANEILLNLNAAYAGANADASALLGYIQNAAKVDYLASEAAYNTTRTISIAIILLGSLFGIGCAAWIIRSITGPMNRMRATITEVEKSGDFTQRIPVSTHDEVGQTAKSFNDLMGALQGTLGQILDSVGKIMDAAQTLSTSSDQVAKSSAGQSEATSAMAAAVEEVTVSINHVSGSAHEAVAISKKAGSVSAEGKEVIQKAASEMTAIAETVRHTATTIEELGHRSDKISSIVQVIKEVADQTNLLALNAAIEAARAGEQGRGFAVVADEVRKLAERTSKATEEITQMITSMQDSSRVAVSTMASAVEKVSGGVALANQAGSSIVAIQSDAERIIDVVNDISTALAEQSSASQDIASQVEKVAQMTEENSAAAGETASAASNLKELAEIMTTAVHRFKI